jgi:hypothetical protein
MASRILVADPDWQFLRQVFGALPRRDYRILVEAHPRRALRFASVWEPDVPVAPASLLEEWAPRDRSALPGPGDSPSLLVTAYGADPGSAWKNWAVQGYEVLLKPLVHPAQVQAAVANSVAPRARAESPEPAAGILAADRAGIGRRYA